MHRSITAALFAVVTAGFLACGDRIDPSATTSPTLAPQLSLSGLDAVVSSVPCDFRATRQAATRYFGSPAQQTAVGIIRQMQAAFGTDPAAVTSLGFDLLRLAAEVTDAGSQQGGAQDGSNLANADLACMALGVALPIDFVAAFSAGGGFAVRGGPGDPTGPVFSRDGYSGIAPPPTGWADWLGGRTLFYGYHLPNFSTVEQPVGDGYQWSTAPPRKSLNGDGVVAVCVENSGQLRLLGEGKILPLVDPAFLDCSAFLASVDAPAGSLFAWAGRALRAGLRSLAPTPLAASTFLAKTGTGGLPGEFSPFGAVNAGSVNLDFAVQPQDAVTGAIISAPTGIQVRARGNGGTALPGVSITLTAGANFGSWTLSGSPTALTDANGVATFFLSLDKPGGYTFTATSSYSGFTSQQVVSDAFHINFP